MYIYSDDTIYVNQYINSEASIDDIKITQETTYPADGKIKISVESDLKYIAVRIPWWCQKFEIDAQYELKNGYAYILIEHKKSININFDMPVVFVKSNRKVHENSGRIAVMRGPVVYCAEGIDNGPDLRSIVIDTDSKGEIADSEFLLPTILIDAYKEKSGTSLYSFISDDYERMKLKLIPYYSFANRGKSEMLVWFLRQNTKK